MMVAGGAQAATEISQIAASDNRAGILATLFVPALGWVAFNILGPLGNQLNRMSDKLDEPAPKKSGTAKLRKRALPAAVGLGAAATLFAAENADAATELAQLAASDNRAGILATLFVPALGWVAFNILGPLGNQLNRMSDKLDEPAPKKSGTAKLRKRSVPAAIGLGAAVTLLAAENADAATELAQLAASDNRAGILATLFVPALGWVAFNILGPLFNQLNRMSDKLDEPAPKSSKSSKKR
jgi:photosystem II PsbY protein